MSREARPHDAGQKASPGGRPGQPPTFPGAALRFRLRLGNLSGPAPRRTAGLAASLVQAVTRQGTKRRRPIALLAHADELLLAGPLAQMDQASRAAFGLEFKYYRIYFRSADRTSVPEVIMRSLALLGRTVLSPALPASGLVRPSRTASLGRGEPAGRREPCRSRPALCGSAKPACPAASAPAKVPGHEQA